METEIDTYTIVEIGPSHNPVFSLFKNKNFENLGKSSRYVGIDCDPDALQEFREYYADKGEILHGDVRDIPLSDEFADQVWLMNVFGGFQSIPKKTSDGVITYPVGFWNAFPELARIVKSDGAIYIGEVYPPCGDVSWLVDEDFSRFGLEKTAHKGYDAVMSFAKTMGAQRALVDSIDKTDKYLQFFLELRKK